MSNEEIKDQEAVPTEKKKISLKEAIQLKLANKKKDQEQLKGNVTTKPLDTKKMSHQNSKKTAVQGRKMGG